MSHRPKVNSERYLVVAADVADKELSAAARQRVADKAKAEAAGRAGTSAAAAQPLPIGLILGAVVLVALMLYLTVKFSA